MHNDPDTQRRLLWQLGHCRKPPTINGVYPLVALFTGETLVSFEAWFAFVLASAVLLVIPGPTILAVISYSIAHGRKANIPLVAAVALGDSTALFASIVGLGTLLAMSAFWFTVVKVVGGVYLLFLGVKLFRSGLVPTESFSPDYSASRWKLFRSAVR